MRRKIKWLSVFSLYFGLQHKPSMGACCKPKYLPNTLYHLIFLEICFFFASLLTVSGSVYCSSARDSNFLLIQFYIRAGLITVSLFSLILSFSHPSQQLLLSVYTSHGFDFINQVLDNNSIMKTNNNIVH